MESTTVNRKYTPQITRLDLPGDNYQKMLETVRLVGRAIDQGSIYLPIRNHAAALATLARPKDYLGQVAEIYKDAIKRWRYVNDPWKKELLTHGPKALWTLVLAGDGVGVGKGFGAGDCDCIAAAVGAQLAAIGRPVRIAITAPQNAPPGRFFNHVFVQANVPKIGWISVDPVGHPKHGFGYTPQHSRIAYFTVSGQLLGATGNVTGFGADEERSDDMDYVPEMSRWKDYGMGAADEAESYAMQEPEDLRLYGIPNYGAYAETMGIMTGDALFGMAVEATPDIYGDKVLARTPMLELDPEDYNYVKVMRRPRDGMMALGDDGQLYEYDGLAGFFKKLFRRVKKRVKRVVKRVRHGVRRVLKKIPGGKYLMKLGKKIYKVANKFVKPLVRFVGKYAAKLAPVAALIPGYGPAIAGALYAAGKVANLMTKYGVKIAGVAGKARSLAFPSGSKAKGFQRALKAAARQEASKRKRRSTRRRPIRGARGRSAFLRSHMARQQAIMRRIRSRIRR